MPSLTLFLKLADCIVLDAPCTAVGVMRRHPDIRLLRQSGDIAKTVVLQKANFGKHVEAI